MIKFILGVAIVCFTSFCGYLLAKKYRQRKSFFVQMNEFNERFLSEIAYYRRPIKEFSEKYEYKGEFDELLSSFVGSLGKSGDAEGQAEKGFLPEYSFLTKDEAGFVRDYFLMVGKGDSASQSAYFTSVKGTLGEYKRKAAEECAKYGDLYLKLGFLYGLMILVIII